MKKNSANFSDKTVVIIPAYEPPKGFVDYARELSENGIAALVVVNDGSNEKYNEIFNEISKIPCAEVVSYETNKGKGYALKKAFSHCKERFDEDYVFVTADCDGQHLLKDVLNVSAHAAKRPSALFLGSRDFSSKNVPARSKSGNIFTRNMFKLLYKISLYDTQTGLRAFSYSMLDKLIAVKGDRFEYEMNMLITLGKSGVDILEIPIETIYNEKSDDIEKVSHFRTIRDSLRVISTLFKNLGWYFFSSAISAVLDVLLFFILLNFVFVSPNAAALNTLFATLIARGASSLVNFFFNFKFVFNGKSAWSVVKYYSLVIVQLCASYLFAFLWNCVFVTAILTTVFKGLSDLLLALLSYQIQSRWVFADTKKDRLKFYSPFLKFLRCIYHIFVPKYRSNLIADENKPCVYLCRHLNLHGPMTVCSSVDFDLHFYVLNNFFTFKKCYKQYSEYTFTERYNKKGIAKFFAKIGAFFSAIFVPMLVRGTRAIAVYRGGVDAVKTYRESMECLSRGENIILFPDIDYTADAEHSSDIYTGFLYLDKLYYRKFGEHLDFVVININEENKSINEVGRVSFTGEAPFSEEMTTVAEKISSLLK